jgi:ubiquinone biosynthesis protein Coq4
MIKYAKAVKLLKEFKKAPDQDKPLEILFAAERILNEKNFHQRYLDFCNLPIAKKVFNADKQLHEIQADIEYLRKLPKDSLGYKFAEFMDFNVDIYAGYQFQAFCQSWDSYLDCREKKIYAGRAFAVHDFVHLLVGYPRMFLGEVHAAAFHASKDQNNNRVFKLLISFGWIRILKEAKSIKSVLYIYRSLYEATRLAKKLPWLPSLPWEDYMHLPIDEVRKIIGITEEDLKYFKKTQERYRTAHYDLLKAEYDALNAKQRELLCSGPNNEEIQRLVAPTL